MSELRLKVEYVPIGSIAPDPANAKEHPDWQVEEIANSIDQFGMDDPIGVAGEPPTIIEGHGRLLACKRLGMERVPIIRLDHLDAQARKAYMLAHNQLTMNTSFDIDALQATMDELTDFDMSDFGFDMGGAADWFASGDKGLPTDEDNDEYKEFVQKFEAKHTTDDCYTPPKVYEAVAKWVEGEYGVERSRFVRPFKPNGDYKAEKYADDAVVVDNPPFSILAEILTFYAERGIDFFLFAPTLTLFSSSSFSSCALPVGANITYENGASVSTSFVTSFGADKWRVKSAPSLYDAVQSAADEVRAESSQDLPKYSYPDEVITSAMVARWSKYGIDFKVSKAESAPCSALDAQKEVGKAIFGKGYLLSERAAAERAAAERAAAERAAAERAAAERAAATRWELSDREREIVKSLGGDAA